MIDALDVTTGRTAHGHRLARVALAMAVLVTTVAAGAGGALAAPADGERVAVQADDLRAVGSEPTMDCCGRPVLSEAIEVEIRELNEEYVAVAVYFPTDTFDEVEFREAVVAGAADRFVFHEDEGTVSLPEDTDGLARPLEVRSIETDSETYHGKLMYFRTADFGNVWERLSRGEEVTIGLGVFTEHTIPRNQWDDVAVSDLAY